MRPMHSAEVVPHRAAPHGRRASHDVAIRALASVLALSVLGACGTDAPTELGSTSLSLDAITASQQRTQLQSALGAPVMVSLLGPPGEGAATFPLPFSRVTPSPSAETLLAFTRQRVATSLSVTRDDATREGASAPSLQVARAAVDAMADEMVPFVDSSLWGKTFVRTPDLGYLPDEAASGAPSRGARVMLYERLASGGLGAVEVGYVDFIDSTTAERQVGRINVYDIAGNAMGSLRVTLSQSESASATTVAATFDGTLGAAGQQLEFADSYVVTMNAGDFAAQIEARTLTRAPFANVSVSLDLVYGGPAMSIVADVRAAGRVMRVESTASAADLEAGLVPRTRILLDDKLVAILDPETEELMAPEGGPVSTDLELFGEAMSGILTLMPSGAIEVSSQITGVLGDL